MLDTYSFCSRLTDIYPLASAHTPMPIPHRPITRHFLISRPITNKHHFQQPITRQTLNYYSTNPCSQKLPSPNNRQGTKLIKRGNRLKNVGNCSCLQTIEDVQCSLTKGNAKGTGHESSEVSQSSNNRTRITLINYRKQQRNRSLVTN